MKLEIVTLFPDYFSLSLRQSLIGKAVDKALFEIDIVNLRDYATDKYGTVDDTPFGGGGGMVMKIEPMDNCLKALGYGHRKEGRKPNDKRRIVLTSAAGKKFDQDKAIQYSLCDQLTIVCGHYLGVDERITRLYEVDELSIGDYTLTGGEPAAAVIIDAVTRLIPGVLGNFESALNDSHMDLILGPPCYTKPADYLGLKVPSELTSGNHREIERFRRLTAIKKCYMNRPDILKGIDLTSEEIEYVRGFDNEFEVD